MIYTCFEKNETFFEQIGNAVPGSFHEQRPKWCPVDFNSLIVPSLRNFKIKSRRMFKMIIIIKTYINATSISSRRIISKKNGYTLKHQTVLPEKTIEI